LAGNEVVLQLGKGGHGFLHDIQPNLLALRDPQVAALDAIPEHLNCGETAQLAW